MNEVLKTEAQFPGAAKRIIVDPDCFVISKTHLEEDKQNMKTIGSTGKGVSPAYRDKIDRKGTRLSVLLKDNNETIIALKNFGVQFKHTLELYNELSKSSIIFEGAQSMLLDINHGTYPFVTSGDCSIASILNSGFAFAMPAKIYGVTKCYSTRVGEGPFPTELHDNEAEELRTLGKEFGATTGRPRRVGWLDIPALNYACRKGGITDLIMTKFDILDGRPNVPVCVSYGKPVYSGSDFFDTKPEYILINGWRNAKETNQLDQFINTIELYLDRKIAYVSCGTSSEDMMRR